VKATGSNPATKIKPMTEAGITAKVVNSRQPLESLIKSEGLIGCFFKMYEV